MCLSLQFASVDSATLHDGLNGFNQAIEAVYPKAEIQRCIVHQIRSSLRYVS